MNLKNDIKEVIVDFVVNSIVLALLVFLVLLFTGCSSQWHLKRAIKKDPSILQKDTITVRDTVELKIPDFQIKDSVWVKHDTVKVDSIIRLFDGVNEAKIRKAIYKQLQKDLEKDSAKLDTLNYNVIAYYKDGNLYVDMERSDSIVQVPFEKEVAVDKVVQKDGWWDKVLKFLGWSFLLLIAIYILRRFVDRLVV
jgi:hypothetical protein